VSGDWRIVRILNARGEQVAVVDITTGERRDMAGRIVGRLGSVSRLPAPISRRARATPYPTAQNRDADPGPNAPKARKGVAR